MDEVIYLDYAATAPLRREVLEAMFPYFQHIYGNPSSVHSVGAQAASALSASRIRIAEVLDCRSEEVIFTSGGSESNNLALFGSLQGRSSGHIVISSVEHEAVLKPAEALARRGFDVTLVPVDNVGTIHPETVARLVRPNTILVSCMHANNEIGTIEPLHEIAAAVRAVNPGVLVHSDAVQAAPYLPLAVDTLGVDLLSLSAHKLGGPRGMGALYVRRGHPLQPQILGGGQEWGYRSGTENVAGAVGMAEALVLAQAERSGESVRLGQLRDRLIRGVAALGPSIELTGHPTDRLPGHASFLLRDRTAESLLVDLDVRNIMCSSGSACHAGMTEPSHVIQAIGYPEHLAHNGLRLTLGRGTTADHVDVTLDAMEHILASAASV